MYYETTGLLVVKAGLCLASLLKITDADRPSLEMHLAGKAKQSEHRYKIMLRLGPFLLSASDSISVMQILSD